MDIRDKDNTIYIEYEKTKTKSNDKTITVEKTKPFPISDLDKTMASSKIFRKEDIAVNTKFSRFGFIDLYRRRTVLKEFLFFTRPDLNLIAKNSNPPKLAGRSYTASDQQKKSLANIPFFKDAIRRYPMSLVNLQSSCSLLKSPFMNIMTNQVSSKLDLPDISAEYHTTTPTTMGVELSVRGHSLKSSNGYDFTLSFKDPDLSIYTMIKAYDEYHNLCRAGEHTPLLKYIKHGTFDDQFTIYKVMIDNDGQSILYMAMLVGCSFTNVPRGDMSDPSEFGDYSLSLHAQHVVDDPALVYSAFRDTMLPYVPYGKLDVESVMSIHGSGKDKFGEGVNNEWVKYPVMVMLNDDRAKRHAPKTGKIKNRYYDYRLLWVK